ncbi:MAG: family N-acetyltransferase [Herminiimonas sp.]|nr:family N-acetyltransferase [Herminiimonas sp.]
MDQVTDKPGAGRSFSQGMSSITCYENEIPDFVEAELARLHGHIFSSLVQFKTYDGLEGASTYVARSDRDAITAILLFQRDGGTVRVLNQGIPIENDELCRFARTIFSRYALVDAISFYAVRSAVHRMPYPYQQFNCSDDYVLTLPRTAEAYLASLGRTTRKNIKYYLNKLRRHFPSFHYSVYGNADVDEHTVRSIIAFNRARMIGKNKVPGINEEEERRILELAKACGFIGVITIENQICAGVIGYRVGQNYFMSVIAHDSRYNGYSIGIMCCYLTICECIARGCKEFHFLWGRYDYKFNLGAVRHGLNVLVLYRSRLRLFLNGGMALRIACNGLMQQVKSSLLVNGIKGNQGNNGNNGNNGNSHDSSSFVSTLAFHLIKTLRSLKRLSPGHPAEGDK